jgi:filamentous hemagglutinin
VPRTVYGFMTKLDRDDHFQCHNPEFDPSFASAEDYEAAGIAFLTGPLTGTMMEGMRRNGDIIRFDSATDEFAICDRNGVLKTYYKPTPAIHKQRDNIVYFRGQLLK